MKYTAVCVLKKMAKEDICMYLLAYTWNPSGRIHKTLVPLTTSGRETWVTGSILCIFSFFFFGCTAYRISVPQPGMEHVPSAVKSQNPNHQATRESLFVF